MTLTADRNPDFLAIRCKERLMRCSPNVGRVLDRVGQGVDEGDRIRADRDHRKRSMVWREAQAVDQHLTPVERAKIGRRRVTQSDHTQQPIVRRIDHGHGV